MVLQALGHFLLGHEVPRDFADFLRQRVEANYFAAAMLMPETAAVPVLERAKQDRRDLAVEDLVDLFSVSYEMAAHRFTNLVTHHLGLPCHFVKNDASGIIYKAYENDGVVFPADPSGAIEGQRMCRQWSGRQVFAAADRFSPYYQYSDTPSGSYFCVAQVDPRADQGFAITFGVPFEHSRWFRGREATIRKRRPARTASAASAARRAGRTVGGQRRGRRPARTRTSCPRCRPALPRRRRRRHLRVPRPARPGLRTLRVGSGGGKVGWVRGKSRVGSGEK